jgi:hypothetical protein
MTEEGTAAEMAEEGTGAETEEEGTGAETEEEGTGDKTEEEGTGDKTEEEGTAETAAVGTAETEEGTAETAVGTDMVGKQEDAQITLCVPFSISSQTFAGVPCLWCLLRPPELSFSYLSYLFSSNLPLTPPPLSHEYSHPTIRYCVQSVYPPQFSSASWLQRVVHPLRETLC